MDEEQTSSESLVGPRGRQRERLITISSGMAVLYCYVTDFDDPGLSRQVISYCSIDPQEIKTIGTDILCSTQQHVSHLSHFVEAAISLLDRCADTWQWVTANIPTWTKRDTALAITSYRAMLLDALFAGAEGDSSFVIRRGDSIADITQNLAEAQARQAARPSRFTPIGMPTDDSQFFISGLLCASSEPADFASRILATWRKMGESSIWRNHGRRLSSFLKGNPTALAGDVTLGDLLRFTAFSALTDEGQRNQQFSLYCTLAKLTPKQTTLGKLFLEMHSRLLNDGPKHATITLKSIQRCLDSKNTYLQCFFNAVRDELFDHADLVGYLVKMSEVGRDYDTFAFLGGILLPREALSPTELPAMLSSSGTMTLSMILGYLFHFQPPPGIEERLKNLTHNYFQSEHSNNTSLRELRASSDAEQLLSRLRHSHFGS